MELSFKKGLRVEFKSGPFVNFKGTVESVDEVTGDVLCPVWIFGSEEKYTCNYKKLRHAASGKIKYTSKEDFEKALTKKLPLWKSLPDAKVRWNTFLKYCEVNGLVHYSVTEDWKL